MKKVISLLSFFCVSLFCAAQIDQNTVFQTTKAYMNAGDTVGVYATINGNPQLMEPIKYVGMKTNALGSALTYGIAKTKLRLVFAGATSPYLFSEGRTHFKFYFGTVPASKAQRYYMFMNSYSLRDFSVSKFVVKSNKRQLTQGSYSIWQGNNTGLETDDAVKISYKTIREGVFDVTIEAQPGEYCFVFNNNGAGGFNTVFDFTIK